MTDPGKFRHQVKLLAYDGAKDELGGLLINDPEHWDTVATVWASVDPISGKEFYAAGQEHGQVTHKVRMRYRAGVTPAMRVKLGARILEIVSVIDWEERHESLLLMCKELTT